MTQQVIICYYPQKGSSKHLRNMYGIYYIALKPTDRSYNKLKTKLGCILQIIQKSIES